MKCIKEEKSKTLGMSLITLMIDDFQEDVDDLLYSI